MNGIVKVSSKYQVVIPRSVRELLGIKPGQEVAVLLHKGHIHLVPVRPMEEMRGFISGIDSHIDREPDRKL